MSIIIDLILVCILAVGAWAGYKKGLLRGIVRIVLVFISFSLAATVATSYSEEFTPALRPFLTGMVDSAYDDALENYNAGKYSEAYADVPEADKSYIVNMETLKILGLSDLTADQFINEKTIDCSTSAGRNDVCTKLCSTFAYVAVYAMAFALWMILFTIVANIINLQIKVPKFAIVDDSVGMIIGFAEAVIIAMFIAWFMGYIGLLISSDVVEDTTILKWFINNNSVYSLIF